MPVSPQEFSLWARMTGNKYPNSVEEKARLAPEVHNFSQNVGKQGALGVQEPTTKDPGNVNMREYRKALGDEYNSLHEQIVGAPGRVDPAVASRYNELNQHIQSSASVFPWNTPSPLDQQTVNRMAGQAIGVDAAAAAEGNKVGQAVGSVAGGAIGGAALGMLDGPAPVLDIVGSTIGSQIGGAIGAHIPQLPAAQENQDEMLTGQHQQLIGARDPRSQGRLPFGLAGTAFDPENYKVY